MCGPSAIRATSNTYPIYSFPSPWILRSRSSNSSKNFHVVTLTCSMVFSPTAFTRSPSMRGDSAIMPFAKLPLFSK